MNKMKIWITVSVALCITSIFLILPKENPKNENSTNQLTAMVISISENDLILQDQKNVIYTLSNENINANIGDKIIIEYTGVLDNEKEDALIVNYSTTTLSLDDTLDEWLDNGIFSDYYKLAYEKMKSLTLEEKIGQILLVRYPDTKAIESLQKYHFGGFVFYAKDFKDKTISEVQEMTSSLQKNSHTALLTAVDEEGGKVVRISSNPNLVSTPFASSQELYESGGFDKIKEDTITKSKILKNLGLNLNLAPVVDVSTNPNDYMYERSFGQNTELTSIYAKTVIESSKGSGVSYTLKHFPGYGNNADTHNASVVDSRSYEDIENNDLPPFASGINAGAEAVLVSHNIVSSIDPDNPASLSTDIHNLLREKLDFTGIVITDDIAMGATQNIPNKTVKAILAGNDLIITTDYEESITEIKNAINDQTLSENLINKLAFRVIAWKYYKGLLWENEK